MHSKLLLYADQTSIQISEYKTLSEQHCPSSVSKVHQLPKNRIVWNNTLYWTWLHCLFLYMCIAVKTKLVCQLMQQQNNTQNTEITKPIKIITINIIK